MYWEHNCTLQNAVSSSCSIMCVLIKNTTNMILASLTFVCFLPTNLFSISLPSQESDSYAIMIGNISGRVLNYSGDFGRTCINY